MARSGCLPELECAINHFSGSPIFSLSLCLLARAARANCNRADLPLLARLGQPGKGARGASTACNTFGCIVLRRRQIIQITYRHSVSRGLLCRTESERRGTDGCAWLGGCLDEGRCQISSVPRFWLCLGPMRWEGGDLVISWVSNSVGTRPVASGPDSLGDIGGPGSWLMVVAC